MIIIRKGGPGSGNKGHKGRPGFVGGSGEGSGTTEDNPAPPSDETWEPGTADVKINEGIGVSINAKKYPTNMKINKMYDTECTEYQGYVGAKLHWADTEDEMRGYIKDDLVKRLSSETGIPYEQINGTIQGWAETSNDTDMRSLLLQESISKEFGIPLSPWQQTKINGIRACDSLMTSRELLQERYDNGETEVQQYIDNIDNSLSYYDDELRSAATDYHKGFQNPAITSEESRRRLVRQIYDDTQSRLEDAGIKVDDTVQLYRGASYEKVDYGRDTKVNYKGNAAESWTIDQDISDGFSRGSDWETSHDYTFSMRVPRRNIFSLSHIGFGCIAEGEVLIFGSIPNSQARIVSHRTMIGGVYTQIKEKIVVHKGGPGSGNKGHKGRPGFVGGSGEGSTASTSTEDNPAPPPGGFTPGSADIDLIDAGTAPASARGWGVQLPWSESPGVMHTYLMVNQEDIQDIYNMAAQNAGGSSTQYNTWAYANENVRGGVKDALVTRLSVETGIPYGQVNQTIQGWAATSNDTDMRSLLMQEAISKEMGIPLSDWQSEKLNGIRTCAEYETRILDINKEIQALGDKGTSGTMSWGNVYDAMHPLNDERRLLQDKRNAYPNDISNAALSYITGNVNPAIPTEEGRMKLVRQMYKDTQMDLEAHGLGPDDTVQLYRGIGLEKGWGPGSGLGRKCKYKGNAAESWSMAYSSAQTFKYSGKHHLVLGMKVPRRNILSLSTTGYGCLTEGEVVILYIPDSRAYILEHQG